MRRLRPVPDASAPIAPGLRGVEGIKTESWLKHFKSTCDIQGISVQQGMLRAVRSYLYLEQQWESSHHPRGSGSHHANRFRFSIRNQLGLQSGVWGLMPRSLARGLVRNAIETQHRLRQQEAQRRLSDRIRLETAITDLDPEWLGQVGTSRLVEPMTEGNQKLWSPKDWSCLNDSIMGGTSQAGCRLELHRWSLHFINWS